VRRTSLSSVAVVMGRAMQPAIWEVTVNDDESIQIASEGYGRLTESLRHLHIRAHGYITELQAFR
jgi:hypothetical protein